MQLFYKQFVETAENAGLKVISDDWCCKLLAWLYAFGGSNEAVTQDPKIVTDIGIARRRLNLYGGEIPNPELVERLRKYMKEVTVYLASSDQDSELPDWVIEISKYYGL
jgi:hypothetical protein